MSTNNNEKAGSFLGLVGAEKSVDVLPPIM